jgi:transglutaminase-like putative cysteine protease
MIYSLEDEIRGFFATARDIDDKVRLVIKQIRRSVDSPQKIAQLRRLVGEIISNSNCRQKDYKCYLAVILDWTRKNIKYLRDPEGLDTFQTAQRTLELGIAYCDDFSVLISSMLLVIGIPVALKIISTDGISYSHIYPLAGLPPQAPSEWIAIDATINKPLGYEATHRIRKQKVYLLSDYWRW